MKLIVPGSGTSHGIPVLGCGCPVCRSEDPKDKRTRASLYIEGDGGERVVIDTGPEFRLQAIRAGITRLDAVLLTHAHADHVHGLDDVRPLSTERPLPVYGNRKTLEEIRERFAYVFRETQRGGGKPHIVLREAVRPLAIGSLLFTPVPVKHGEMDILGWRIDGKGGTGQDRGAVYLTDTSAIPLESRSLIGSPQILIIGGLRTRPHATHFSFEEALNAGVELGARRIFLTHICHDYTHREINRYCRDFITARGLGDISMEAAWDGMELDLK
ncbi:MAG: MBL fold metallo-hydrolase [Treponema sp.]|jgi:phosphoribosyl 1,2-cyclic phosphate phosphodiesterase|nr:MBL fold metallo-hydrolase [Treponema sp.]